MNNYIYVIVPFNTSCVKIGKTTRPIKDLRSDYTRSFGSNMCIHYFETGNIDLNGLENYIHSELKEYKTTNEIYKIEYFELYLQKISQIISHIGRKTSYPIHYLHNDVFMQWYPTR